MKIFGLRIFKSKREILSELHMQHVSSVENRIIRLKEFYKNKLEINEHIIHMYGNDIIHKIALVNKEIMFFYRDESGIQYTVLDIPEGHRDNLQKPSTAVEMISCVDSKDDDYNMIMEMKYSHISLPVMYKLSYNINKLDVKRHILLRWEAETKRY